MISKLRKCRLDLGWNIADTAQKIGFSISYLHDIETGKRNVGVERAEQIAKLYGTDVEDLFMPIRYAVRVIPE